MKHADSIQSYKAYLANLEASTINNIQMWLLDYTCSWIDNAYRFNRHCSVLNV